MPLVQALSDFNGVPYRQFYGYDFAYESFAREDVWNLFYLMFSFLYAYSGIHAYKILWAVFRKKIDLKSTDMGFFRKWAYILYRESEVFQVPYYNGMYIKDRFLALVTTAMLMWWTYPVFVVYKIFRGKSFDFDFDELAEEGKKLSNKQGVVYHYWKDDRYQTMFASYKTHVIDFWVGVLGFVPWLIINVIYWPYLLIMGLTAPMRFAWRALTPWDE